MSPGPPPHVLAAFGAGAAGAVPLGGGQGTSWRAGDLVLKPADIGRDELSWQAALPLAVCGDGFRLARYRTAAGGRLCVDGWCATEYLAGRHEAGRWAEIIAVGERLHAALRDMTRPAFLGERSGPWAAGDRVAWGEQPAAGLADARHLRRLAAALRPVDAPSQVIHGDLTGNVLFHDRLPPAIIDFSPYWRPADYASAMVVADALVWEGADARILGAVRHIADFGQYLLRALMFRAVTEHLIAGGSPASAAQGRWALAVDLACEVAGRRRGWSC